MGAPLRVHRRCGEPMFIISNHIAYSGMMIHDKVSGGAKIFPDSRWIDVASERSDGHWVEEEGRATKALLRKLKEDVFLISPFRDVANHLNAIGKAHYFTRPQEQTGTIHLGGDPKKVGDKEWAAGKANLLNVAVSRAKRTLLVVGNRTLWKEHSYFKVAARILKVEKFG